MVYHSVNCHESIFGETAMIVETRIFKLCKGKYKNLSELADAMGISVSQVYRVRCGQRNINHKFIVGAINAFPEFRFGDLVYFAPGQPPLRHENNRQAVLASKVPAARDQFAQHLESSRSVA